MLVFALISLVVSPVQDGAIPYGAAVYTAPAVRPFEPPSNFGRVTAEGDGGGDVTRRPISRPVAVESYRGSYEYTPSNSEAAYNQGVARAQTTMDARMGPLDGRWHVKDASGATVLALVLMDAGPSKPLEGAWRKDGPTDADLGVIEQAERSDTALILGWTGGGLTLHPSGHGWAGELTEGDRTTAVTLTR